MKKFVFESLEELLEYVNRGEDMWADQEIDRYLGKESPDTNSSYSHNSPEEIFNNPSTDTPNSTKELYPIIKGLVDYSKGKVLTPEEFYNFCLWITYLTPDPDLANNVLSTVLSHHPYIVDDFRKISKQEISPRDSEYLKGLDLIIRNYVNKAQQN